MSMANDVEFIHKQQFLALQVARLPMLRKEYQVAKEKVSQGFLGNAALQREEYENCVRWIKDIVKEM